MRQLQSSNVLHILQSAPDPGSDHASDSAGLALIAKCGGLLELVPATVDAHAHLRQQLPSHDDEDQSPNAETRPAGLSSDQAASEAPFSTREFEAAWRQACACEIDGRACLPTAKVLKGAWESLLLAMTAGGVRMDEPFRIADVLQSVMEDGATRREVYEAVMLRVSSDDGEIMDGCMFPVRHELQVLLISRPGMRMDAAKCVPWLGGVLLDSMEGPRPRVEFESQWQDLLPEGWSEFTRMNVLQVRTFIMRSSASSLISMSGQVPRPWRRQNRSIGVRERARDCLKAAELQMAHALRLPEILISLQRYGAGPSTTRTFRSRPARPRSDPRARTN